jgi:PPOX class probable F420-dependent enzyme
MAELSAQEASFLGDNPFPGVLTTLRPDGSPHSSVIWVDVLDDGTLQFNTARGRAKERYLQRDPRLSIVVIDSSDDARWISISGRAAEWTEAGADAQTNKLTKKYLGLDEYPWRVPGEVRVSVTVGLDRVESSGV